ncbi:hypothetical protein JL720_14351 [Aureococcus anophagefferens]|nr:hypothetical protein JL720_14351 [Aureococcus anophagefferens]
MPQNRFNIFERFKTHDITDYRELAYFFGVAAAEEALLDEQAPPESDVAGNTVMTFAAACGRQDHRAAVENANATPFYVAAHQRHVDVMRYLVAEGRVDVLATTKVGQTALHQACRAGGGQGRKREGHGDVLTLLLDAGADAEAPGEKRATPVHYATENGHVRQGPARKRCGKCRKVHYRSQLCQMGHWATHTHACGVVLAKAPPKAPRPPGDESESEEEDTRPRDMYGEIDRRPPEDTTRMIGV